MRIISGTLKGKRLSAPKKLPARPTTDMHKEALFNVINNYYNFSSISVLDLFAGIGSLTLEFASRGASPIVAVDKHAGCMAFIGKTAQDLELDVQIIETDVFSFLNTNLKIFDLIIADPPYDFLLEDYHKIYHNVFDKQLLTPEGMLIVEHSKYIDLSDLKYFSFEKKYGGTTFSFFEL